MQPPPPQEKNFWCSLSRRQRTVMGFKPPPPPKHEKFRYSLSRRRWHLSRLVTEILFTLFLFYFVVHCTCHLLSSKLLLSRSFLALFSSWFHVYLCITLRSEIIVLCNFMKNVTHIEIKRYFLFSKLFFYFQFSSRRRLTVGKKYRFLAAAAKRLMVWVSRRRTFEKKYRFSAAAANQLIGLHLYSQAH